MDPPLEKRPGLAAAVVLAEAEGLAVFRRLCTIHRVRAAGAGMSPEMLADRLWPGKRRQ